MAALAVAAWVLLGGAPGASEYIYTFGGNGTPGIASDVYFAQVLGGGTLSGWTSTTPLPAALNEHWACYDGAYVYVFGGSSSSAVYSAQLSPSGVVGSWNSQTPLPGFTYNSLTGFDTANAFAYLHGTGGAGVFSAAIAGGTVSGWASQTALPSTVSEHAGCTEGGFSFVYDPSSSGMWSSPIAGGAVGGWSTQASPIASEWAAQIVANGSDLYFISGCSGTYAFGATQSGGSIGGWTSLTGLPTGVCEGAAVIAGGYLFILGGSNNGSTAVADVFSAQLLAGAGLGSWQSVAPIPLPEAENAAVAMCFNSQGTPVSCAPVTQSATSTATQTRTRTPTPAAPQMTATKSPTCAYPIASVTPPFLYVNRNVFDPEVEPLQVIWAVADPSAVQVQVFNSAGEFVRQLALQSCGSGLVFRVLWDGKNFQDRLVTANVYVLRMVSLGSKNAITRRVAVLRSGSS